MYRCLALFLLAWGPATAQAPSPPLDTLFQSGNEAYATGRPGEALKAYRQILDAGSASVALYHNMGNAHLRLGETGRAVQAYVRGLQLAPGNRQLVHNLRHARDRADLTDPGPVFERSGLTRVLGGSAGGLAAVGWGLVVAGLGLAAYRAAPNRPGRMVSVSVGSLVGSGLVVWTLSLGLSALQMPDRRAVVLADAVPVHSTPSDTTAITTTVREGRVLGVERTRNGWTRIRLANGVQGWVRTASVGEV